MKLLSNVSDKFNIILIDPKITFDLNVQDQTIETNLFGVSKIQLKIIDTKGLQIFKASHLSQNQ